MIYVFLYIIVGLLFYIATALAEDCEAKERHIAPCVLLWPLWLIILGVTAFQEHKSE